MSRHEHLAAFGYIGSALLLIAATAFVLVSRPQLNPNDFATDVRDDSDPPRGASGMKVLTDNLTGCQYLKRFWSAPAPRMEAYGQGQRQICRREW